MLVATELPKTIKILDDEPLLGDEWMVSQKFSRNGKDIYVKGFGKTSREAWSDFRAELEEENNSMSNIFIYYLGELLWIANANKPNRHSYYELKDLILKKYGTLSGYDIQHIKQDCYICGGTGYITENHKCRSCFGTGKYKEFWSKLDIYKIGNRMFHLPVQMYYIKPDEEVTVVGYIRNNDNVPFIKSYRAFMFLRFIFKPKEYFKIIGQNWYWSVYTKISSIGNLFDKTMLKIKRSRCQHDFGDNLPFCNNCNIYNPAYEDIIPF